MANLRKLIIVDLSSFIFRAYYAVPPLTAPDGTPVNAVHGILSMFLKLMSEHKPTHLLLAQDTKEGSFRKELYPKYKANRSAPPEDLIPQFDLIDNLVQEMGLLVVKMVNYEADDVIGSVAVQWKDDFDEVLIASSDKDLMQFVDGKVKLLDTMKSKTYGIEEVRTKMGVYPHQIVDYLSIVGDASDNIPGMRGIGAKGAAKMLGEYKNLEGCIKNKDTFTNKRVKNAFENHIEDALLSKKLVSIPTDLDLSLKESDALFSFHLNSSLESYLKQLGFQSTLKKLKDWEQNESHAHSQLEEKALPIHQFPLKTIASEQDFQEFAQTLAKSPNASFVFSKNLAVGLEQETYLLPPLNETQVKVLFESFLGDATKLVIGLDLKQLYHHFPEMKAQVFDLALAHYHLHPGMKHDLATLVFQYLNKTFDPLEPAQELAESAYFAFQLLSELKAELKAKDVEKPFQEIDTPLLKILQKMEADGIRLNQDYFYALEERFTQEIQSIEVQIREHGQLSDEFNIRSPKQISELLFKKLGYPVIKKTKTGASTDSSVLEALVKLGEGEVPALILRYRELDKLLSTYIKVLPGLVHAETGKIHTTFKLTTAATGRLSSDHPNLQNIPIKTENGRLLRKGFVAEPGCLLLSADYSQIELRLLAHFSEDPTMLQAFRENKDVHTQTAAEVFGTSLEDVSYQQRSMAKAINFGLMYGQSAFGLSQLLGISRKEASDYIQLYFERFGLVKDFLSSLKEQAKENGYAETLYGRKRFLPDIYSKNHTVRTMAERMAVNSPIQGTAADLIKKAMIVIDHKLKDFKTKMLLQVHDELIFNVPEEELAQVRELVQDSMESIAKLRVPLKVDLGVGVNWFDLK